MITHMCAYILHLGVGTGAQASITLTCSQLLGLMRGTLKHTSRMKGIRMTTTAMMMVLPTTVRPR